MQIDDEYERLNTYRSKLFACLKYKCLEYDCNKCELTHHKANVYTKFSSNFNKHSQKGITCEISYRLTEAESLSMIVEYPSLYEIYKHAVNKL